MHVSRFVDSYVTMWVCICLFSKELIIPVFSQQMGQQIGQQMRGKRRCPFSTRHLKKHPSLDQDFVRQLDFKSMVATSTL